MKQKRIMVPLDGSTLAETAMWTALDLAERSGATIVLLRVAVAYPKPGTDLVAAQLAAVREADQYLAAATRRLRASGFERIESHVWNGSPAAAVVEAAKAQRADMIVMTTHGRSGFGRLILGSVAESVLRGTRVPVLIVREASAPIDIPAGVMSARTTA
jgi:nucleotide-binding universal stress UspA family protein